MRPRIFSLAILATLIAGTVATSVVWIIGFDVLVKPLPFPDSQRLVRIFEENPHAKLYEQAVSPGSFQEWQRRTRSFDQLAIFALKDTFVRKQSSLYAARIASVSTAFFSTLAVDAELGRRFGPDEGAVANAAEEIVISHAAWLQWFGGSPSVLGSTLWLEGSRPFTVVGVMPTGVSIPDAANAWRLELLPENVGPVFRSVRSYGCIGRLRPEASLSRARAELAAIETELGSEYPASNAGWTTRAERLDAVLLGPVQSPVAMLALCAGGFLLVCICNVVYLQLARSVSRRAEMGVRVALGATRARVISLVGSELLLISATAACISFVAGDWLFRFALHLLPGAIIALQDVRYAPVGWFCAALLPSLLCVPAAVVGMSTAVGNWNPIGTSRAIVSKDSRLSEFLIGTQSALTVALLIASMLFVYAFWHLLTADLGFQARDTIAAEINIPRARVAGPRPWPQVRRLVDGVTADIAANSATEAVGVVTKLPLSGEGGTSLVWLASATKAGPVRRLPLTEYQWTAVPTLVSPGYFNAIGMKIREGRGFDDRDTVSDAYLTGANPQESGSAIVNEAFVEKYLANRSALGRSLVLLDAENFARTWTVVGIINDAATRSTAADAQPTIYIPFAEAPTAFRIQLVVRSREGVSRAAQVVSDVLRAQHPDLMVTVVRPLNDIVSESRASQALTTGVLVACALVALVVAVCGIYGTVSLAIQRRLAELALRLALGAPRARASSVIIIRAAAPVFVGSVAGTLSYTILEHILRGTILASSSVRLFIVASAPVCLLIAAALAVAPALVSALRADPAVLLHEAQ